MGGGIIELNKDNKFKSHLWHRGFDVFNMKTSVSTITLRQDAEMAALCLHNPEAPPGQAGAVCLNGGKQPSVSLWNNGPNNTDRAGLYLDEKGDPHIKLMGKDKKVLWEAP